MTTPTIVEFMRGSRFLGSHFQGASWDTWEIILRATYCLPMTPAEQLIFTELTGGRTPPERRPRVLVVKAHRRGGKSAIASLLGTFSAVSDHGHKLRVGERASIVLLAVDRQQSAIILNMARGYFATNELLARMVERETRDGIQLYNGSEIIVQTSDFRSIRGKSIALAVLDEAAYIADENSVNPDFEIFRALVPAMMTMKPDDLVVLISTPRAQSGLFHAMVRDNWANNDSDVLVVSSSALGAYPLNPLLDVADVRREIALDPEGGRSEWEAEFRTDITTLLDPAVVQSNVIPERRELLPVGTFVYSAFVDPSGGSSDSMCLAIGHAETRERVQVGVLDVLMEFRPPFDPDVVVKEMSDRMRSYRCGSCYGDRYGGDWPTSRFQAHGIEYVASEKSKSEIYLAVLPLLNGGRTELLDNARLISQFCSLERRVGRGTGREIIDSPPRQHDDLANVASGVLVAVAGQPDPVMIRKALQSPEAQWRAANVFGGF